MQSKKRYYQAISKYDDFTINEIWHCSHNTATRIGCDFIIPLDRKPRGIDPLDIREGA